MWDWTSFHVCKGYFCIIFWITCSSLASFPYRFFICFFFPGFLCVLYKLEVLTLLSVIYIANVVLSFQLSLTLFMMFLAIQKFEFMGSNLLIFSIIVSEFSGTAHPGYLLVFMVSLFTFRPSFIWSLFFCVRCGSNSIPFEFTTQLSNTIF